MDEASFIKRLQEGEDLAFKSLVDDNQQMVVNTCFGFLHNYEEAEDIAQEVFIQVYNRINTFRGDSKLTTWIYRIAVNKSLNKIRSRKSKFLVTLDAVFVSEYDSGKQAGDNPYTSLENQERAEILHSAIDKLPENQKTAFILSKYQGLPNKNIAEVMKHTLSSVEALLNRAKKNLQKSLTSYYRK